MSVFELKADLRRRLKLVRDEIAKPLPADPMLVLVYRPDSTNAGVTTAGVFLSNYVGDQLWKTDNYGTAEARIQKYNLRFTSVVTYQVYLRDCEANLSEILGNL